MSHPLPPSEFETRAQRVRVLVLDVDGVLTDGRLLYLPDGRELKVFHARDGLGVQLMIASGCPVALISGRKSDAVRLRAHELGIELMFLGIEDKVATLEQIVDMLQIDLEEVAYIGDDLPDLPLLERVGLGFAPADAAPEVRSSAHVVLRASGGQGAVREACERVLKAQGAWRV